MYKLVYFVPTENKESTKEALFKVSAGRYNDYECCCFETLGTGQFKPINNANPHIGTINNIEQVEEYRIEMICEDHLIKNAVQTLKDIHPYEEVAYDVLKLEDI